MPRRGHAQDNRRLADFSIDRTTFVLYIFLLEGIYELPEQAICKSVSNTEPA